MSAINDLQRQQMRHQIHGYLDNLLHHKKGDIGSIANKLEDEAFKKGKSFQHYRQLVAHQLELIKRKLVEQQDANAHAARAQLQSQAAHKDHVARSLQSHGHVPRQNPNHASSAAHGSHISAQSYQRDSLGQAGGYPFFSGHHPTSMIPQQQPNFPPNARPPGVQLGDPSQFMGVPQQPMHSCRNVGMQRTTPGPMDNYQQQASMFQRAPSHANIGMGGNRPTMSPLQNIAQHSQPIPHHLPANGLVPPVYPAAPYPSMAVQPPAHGNVKLLQNSVQNMPLQQQPPAQIIAQGHQKQLLESIDQKSLEEKFLKKRSELHAKYSRDINSMLMEYMQLDEPKRETQYQKVFDQMRRALQFLNPNESLIPKINPDLYSYLCQLENQIPSYIQQFSKISKLHQHKLMKMRQATSQGPATPQQYGSMLHNAFSQRQAPIQQPQNVGAPQEQDIPASKLPPRAEPRQAKTATAGQSDRQKDSNPEVHKTASNRPNRKHTAQALVSMLANMSSNKISQLQQDLQPLVNTQPFPPSNPPKGFFSAGDPGHNAVQPLRLESRSTAKFGIANAPRELGESNPTGPGTLEVVLHASPDQSTSVRKSQLEKKRKRVQEAMGDSVIVTIQAASTKMSGVDDLLVVDWKDDKDEIESTSGDTERDSAILEQKTVPWKRLRLDVNLDAEYSDDASPVALFSSQDTHYRSEKCVAARRLFRSKLPSTGSSVLGIVESWAASCSEIDRIFA